MYYILNEGTYPQPAIAILEQAFKVDRGEKTLAHDDMEGTSDWPSQQHLKKCRTHTCEILKLSPEIYALLLDYQKVHLTSFFWHL